MRSDSWIDSPEDPRVSGAGTPEKSCPCEICDVCCRVLRVVEYRVANEMHGGCNRELNHEMSKSALEVSILQVFHVNKMRRCILNSIFIISAAGELRSEGECKITIIMI